MSMSKIFRLFLELVIYWSIYLVLFVICTLVCIPILKYLILIIAPCEVGTLDCFAQGIGLMILTPILGFGISSIILNPIVDYRNRPQQVKQKRKSKRT